MNWSETMHNYLTDEPQARERKNKNRAIGNKLAKKYGKSLYGKDGSTVPTEPFSHFEFHLTKQEMADLVGDCLTADRAWRKTLEDYPELRGTDYPEKDELELKKQQELGY